MTDNQETGGLKNRAEEFLQIFKKGAEFTQELLKENERLRFRLLEVDQQLGARMSDVDVQLLRERLRQVEAEKQEILAQISSVEKANIDFSNRYAEIEGENNLLANLYITLFQLHSTLDVQEIFRIIEEILLNLIGVEEFTLVLVNKDGSMVQPVLSATGDYQLDPVVLAEPRANDGLATGLTWVASDEDLGQLSPSEPLAVIPLQVDDEILGALVIRRLLAQKQGFTDIDQEIFGLLGGHAAMAICVAVLRQEKRGRISFNPGMLA